MKCSNCGARIEGENFDACWKCSSPLSDEDLSAATLERDRLKASMNCPRCSETMEYAGLKKFHEGAPWGFWLGDLGELFVNREGFDLYACPNCGRLEFFVSGVGNDKRV